MYYFLHGKNTKEAHKKLKSLVEILHKKREHAEIFRMNIENWNEGQFNELLMAQGLFDQKYIVILDSLFESKEVKEIILDKVKEMKESENVFLILESVVDKKSVDKISKYADKVQEFAEVEEKEEKFNTFILADLFGNRDKKNLWIGYLKAIDLGITPEEISGVLFWQMKNIFIVKKTKDAKEAKLAPFVYSKALNFARNFTSEEIGNYSRKIVESTQAVRQGEGEMEIFLEKIILSV